jgi:hypothetical protein
MQRLSFDQQLTIHYIITQCKALYPYRPPLNAPKNIHNSTPHLAVVHNNADLLWHVALPSLMNVQISQLDGENGAAIGLSDTAPGTVFVLSSIAGEEGSARLALRNQRNVVSLRRCFRRIFRRIFA